MSLRLLLKLVFAILAGAALAIAARLCQFAQIADPVKAASGER